VESSFAPNHTLHVVSSLTDGSLTKVQHFFSPWVGRRKAMDLSIPARLSNAGRPTSERGQHVPSIQIRQLTGPLEPLQFPVELSKRKDHKYAAEESKHRKYC
jgi:hypothetical protein